MNRSNTHITPHIYPRKQVALEGTYKDNVGSDLTLSLYVFWNNMSHTDNAIIDSMNEIKEQAMDEMTAEQMEDHAFDVWCQQNEKIIHQKAFERAFEAALEE